MMDELKEMTEGQIGWIAGIIEGEGNFCLNRKNGKKTASVRISVAMTDLDVLEELQSTTGMGTINPKRRPKGKEHWKPCWTWRVAKQRDVVDLINAIRPWLKVRRSKQAAIVFDYAEMRLNSRLKSNSICNWDGCSKSLEGRIDRTKFCCRQHKVNHNVNLFRKRNFQAWDSGICGFCDNPFTKNSSSARYCTEKCRKEAKLEYQRQSRAKLKQ